MATIAKMAEAGYMAFEEHYKKSYYFAPEDDYIIPEFETISQTEREAWIKAATVIWHMGFSENWPKMEARTSG